MSLYNSSIAPLLFLYCSSIAGLFSLFYRPLCQPRQAAGSLTAQSFPVVLRHTCRVETVAVVQLQQLTQPVPDFSQ